MGNMCLIEEDPEVREARKRDRDIAKLLKIEKRKQANEIKLLLLGKEFNYSLYSSHETGAGESGKSTIFKQMKILHENGYSEEERNMFKDIIYGNTLQSIRVLIGAMKKFGIPFEKKKNEPIADKILRIPDQQIILNPGAILTPQLGEEIRSVWKDKGCQAAYEQRSKFQLNDSANYYLNAIDRIAKPDYIPTVDDVLHSRVRTVGIVEADFMIDGYKFNMVDVGGQRNERRKWIHCFDDVTAVIFVTSLSEYDQTLAEDESTNRMDESLALFAEIANCRYFKNTPLIIFFNKEDLFTEKIKKVDLNVCFPEYTGGKNKENALKFIINKFLEKNENKKRTIFYHVTQATDTRNIKVVFDATRHIILQKIIEDVQLG